MDQGRQRSLGRYQLLKKIAVGGMAEIYLARMTGAGGFEKNVVLKRILPQLAESDELFRMFLDEARIAATLQHPNVVQIYDAGEQDGDHFIAMEYLDGADLLTLCKVLARNKAPFPLELALHVGISVAAGLHYAHDKEGLDGQPLHIVHRDVTPHNVFITREGTVKLVDFGIAKATNRTGNTSYGTLKGKLPYMSPEQCRGEDIDRRSDIYSLGIILYELTTGSRLYAGRSEYRVLKEIVEEPVPPPSQLRADYPVELERIIMRALEKDVSRRYQTARDIQLELLDFARSLDLDVSPIALSEFVGPVLEQARREMKDREQKRERSRAANAPRVVDTLETQPPLYDEDDEDDTGSESAPVELPPAPRLAPRPVTPAPAPPPADAQTRRMRTPLPVAEVPFDPLGGHDGVPYEAIDLRRRTGAWFAGVLVLAAAGAAYWYYVNRPADAEPPTSAAPAAQPEPEKATTGTLTVASSPSDATVWLLLDRTPIESPPLAISVAQAFRFEHDGYEPGFGIVDPANGWQLDRGQNRAELAVTLTPTDTTNSRPSRREQRELEQAAQARAAVLAGLPASIAAQARSPTGSVQLRSEPAAARVWLRLGRTPDAQMAGMSTRNVYELRVEKDGYEPSFVKVTPEDFGERGRANVQVGLAPVATED